MLILHSVHVSCVSQEVPPSATLPEQGNVQDNTIDDVSCNFYNYTLTTENS